jgi:poly-gamma-glutamate synthesis protein (capsule biosynthesis protein)
VAKLFEEKKFASVLSEFKSVVSKVDYSIVNFECPITRGGEKPIIKQGPSLQCTEEGIEAMQWAGINCVALANNHLLDFGEDGVRQTLEACKKYGIDTIGGGINIQEASRILYKTIGEATVAFINCCEHEFSIATEKTPGANPLNPIQQYYTIQEAKKQSDHIIIIVHGGHEHYQLPSPRMQELYRFFINVGADAVINNHQHCYSGYELYQGKPIFYGLGNLCFDFPMTDNKTWNEGYMVILDIKQKMDFEIIPYRQCQKEPTVNIIEKSSYNNTIEDFNKTINDPKKLEETVASYYETCANSISTILEPSNNRYYLGARKRGWLPTFISQKRKIKASNYICCESHREKLIYFLSKL